MSIKKPKVPAPGEDPLRWRNQLLVYLDRTASASADVSTTSISITGADADLTYDANERDLINELKSDVNQLITDFNNLINDYNDLKAKLRAAQLLET